MINAHISLITYAETVTDKMKGEILKLFLGPKVQTALSSEIKYDDKFWSDPQNVFDELKLIYERPNKVEHSLQKLQDLKMQGKNLSIYQRAHIELCSMAKLDPDGKPQLYLFVKNLNNNATTGGLCAQVLGQADKEGISHTGIFRYCDKLLTADSGSPEYESNDRSGMVKR